MKLNVKQGDTRLTTRLICSANHGFAPYAQEELRRRFGAVKSRFLVPGEVFVAALEEPAENVVEQLVSQPPIFLRHMFVVDQAWEVAGQGESGAEREDAVHPAWISELQGLLKKDDRLQQSRIAIQTRKSEQSAWSSSAAELKDAIQGGLDELNAEFVVRDADWIISVFAAVDAVYMGIAKPEHNISDWNGGAVRFQKEEGQISRAKFKLLEAEKVFGIDFSSFHQALDIGAAPGGWTSFLLERGLDVTAVDPAKLHPSVLASPRLTYIQKNAGRVQFKDNQFDLLVCDMSWSPKLTAKLVTELLYCLVPGGTAVITVKLLTKKPMALIQEVMTTFQDARLQIQRAKQLFHNRDEITLYMVKY
ncbi:SAM-dependent methyltransferase [Paenibacillus apis]|uniref:SAM-dependent methyltransferase n=1 Tax=Paenibacillus apis TaxID=1792174 RepID=UPI00265B5090|nr:SAM-dependent methyltransferase [Paenibacillus apis]